METRILTGNDALALGALRAGVKVVTGYPGTPSTGAIEGLLRMDLPGRHVEWSTNEKVALEIAAGAAWAGHRALCTMKMSGVNVAYDSLISIAYSGCNGGFVIYVADDPGVSAGMAEQDSRGFALMSDLPMLEPATVQECYDIMPAAFDLSERIGSPVFVRLVTAVSGSDAIIQVDEPIAPEERTPILEWDISRYTKAGAGICMAQHRDLIARLGKAELLIGEMGLNHLTLSSKSGGLGLIVCGVVAAYLDEALEIAGRSGARLDDISILRIASSVPIPSAEVRRLLDHCGTIAVLEELEPHIEQRVYVLAQRAGYRGSIIGKIDGTFERVGEYGIEQIVRAVASGQGLELPEGLFSGYREAEQIAAARPITVCAGCPHRGTYLAINQALRKLRFKKHEVMVTGDIGCTILGMNPPFETVWNEISMGASISLAQGYVYSEVKTPVIATIGDSTFFHGGIPGLINAVQHQVPLTLIVMDNGWTGMTGMQVNAGTAPCFQQPGGQRVDITRVIPALGVEQFFIMDPFDLEESTQIVMKCLQLPGVKVIVSRQECAIQAQRQGLKAGLVQVVAENCNLCRLCVTMTGCPAIDLGADAIVIDPKLCYGCGLCVEICNRDAIIQEKAAGGARA